MLSLQASTLGAYEGIGGLGCRFSGKEQGLGLRVLYRGTDLIRSRPCRAPRIVGCGGLKTTC